MFHGGNLQQASTDHNIPLRDWLDLSTGINPCPYPVDQLPQDVWHRLPYPAELKLLEDRARQYYQVSEHADIVAAPGSSALIAAMPVLAFSMSFPVILTKQSYQEHQASWHKAGALVKLVEEHDTFSTTSSPGHRADQKETCLIQVIVNPNNPTGKLHHPNTLMEHRQTLGQDGLLVVDEAFMDCSPNHSLAPVAGQKGLVILRSFGKFFGLAGLRLGFAIGHPEDIALLRQQIGPWPVSGAAISIATQAMTDTEWIKKTHHNLSQSSQALNALLKDVGLEVIGTTDLFTLVSNDKIQKIHVRLAKHAIWTRMFSYEKNWLRIGLPSNKPAFSRLKIALGSPRL